MRWRIFAAVVLMAVGVGAVGLVVLKPTFGTGQSDQYLTTQASRTDVVKEAVATGTVAARTAYGLSFGGPPQLVLDPSQTGGGGTAALVDGVSVKVGDSIKVGDVLATSDTSSLEVDLAIAEAQLGSARARLVADQGGPAADVVAAAEQAISQAELAYKAAVSSSTNTTAQNSLTLAQAEGAVAEAEANLAEARAGPTADQIADAQDALDRAGASLDTAQQSLGYVQRQNELSVKAAQAAVQQAQDKLYSDMYNSPAEETLIANDRAAVDAAQRNLESATLNAEKSLGQAQQQVDEAQVALAAAQRSFEESSTPSSDAIEAAQKALTTAQDNLASAKLRTEQSSSSNAQQVAQARLSLQSARTSYTTKTEPASADVIASDQAQVASAQAAVSDVQLALARASLVSPVDGIVVAVNIVPGVAAPSGYAIVVQSRDLQVTANFAESDLPTLAVDQAATVTISAAGRAVAGTVTQITPVAATSGGSSVVTFAVVVALDTPPADVWSGMSAEVSVTTATALDVIAVPAIAVLGSAGSYTVRVLDANGALQVRAVEVGLTTSSLAEIRSGLSEGEAVVIGTTAARQGTSTFGQGGFTQSFGGFPGGGRSPNVIVGP